jgi:hypothetical protein
MGNCNGASFFKSFLVVPEEEIASHFQYPWRVALKSEGYFHQEGILCGGQGNFFSYIH